MAASGLPRPEARHGTKLRFDPATLTVDTSDFRFSSSVGSVNHGDDIAGQTSTTRIAYGVARDCAGYDSALGHANIDLRDTPFAVAASTAWMKGGYLPGGLATASVDRKVVTVTGGGYCGWNAIAGARLGGPNLHLEYAP